MSRQHVGARHASQRQNKPYRGCRARAARLQRARARGRDWRPEPIGAGRAPPARRRLVVLARLRHTLAPSQDAVDPDRSVPSCALERPTLELTQCCPRKRRPHARPPPGSPPRAAHHRHDALAPGRARAAVAGLVLVGRARRHVAAAGQQRVRPRQGRLEPALARDAPQRRRVRARHHGQDCQLGSPGLDVAHGASPALCGVSKGSRRRRRWCCSPRSGSLMPLFPARRRSASHAAPSR